MRPVSRKQNLALFDFIWECVFGGLAFSPLYAYTRLPMSQKVMY